MNNQSHVHTTKLNKLKEGTRQDLSTLVQYTNITVQLNLKPLTVVSNKVDFKCFNVSRTNLEFYLLVKR